MSRSPRATALSDQTLAAARTTAQVTQIPVLVFVYANGEQCTWCDCDITAEEHDPAFCAGCPRGADVVMHLYSGGGGVRRDIPLCAGHQDDATAFVLAIVRAGGRL